jgi:hypothetical protein
LIVLVCILNEELITSLFSFYVSWRCRPSSMSLIPIVACLSRQRNDLYEMNRSP